MKTSTSEFHLIGGLRQHVRLWGAVDAPKLFLLHGWMDMSATFQFVVDALAREWRVIAPDWRGFGLSEWQHSPYWFPDYLADLDALLEIYSPQQAVNLAGHSMGGNVACLYTGIRPQRIAKLASLEGFGMPATQPSLAPSRYRFWLDQLRKEATHKTYAGRAALAARLQHGNPRLSAAQAEFLAQHGGAEQKDGGVSWAGDPYHRHVNPLLYRLDEAMACWLNVEAPVLWVTARDSAMAKGFREREDDYCARLACFRNLREVTIEDAGHNMQHDQPQVLARLLEDFFAG